MIKKYLILIILSLIVLFYFSFFFYPYPKILVTPDFGLSDVWNLNFPYKDNLAKNLKLFQLPLWSDKIASGYPVFAEGQTGTLNIVNLILFFLFPSWLAFNLGYVTIFLTIALGTYWYCRTIKLTKISSLWVSIVFTFSGVFTARLPHFNLLQTASFLPIILALTELTLKKKRLMEPLIISFILTQAYFAGFPQMLFIILVCQIIYLTLKFYLEKKVSKKLILYFIFSYGLFFGLSAIQFLPTQELIKTSIRGSSLSFSEITRFTYNLKHLLLFVKPFLLGNPALGTYPHFLEGEGIYWENIAYLGILPLILCVVSFLLLKKNRIIIIYLFILILSLLLSLGKNSPLYLLYTLFPFNLFRVPSRFLLLTAFSISVLSGFGLEKINHIKNRFINRSLILLFFIISIYHLFSFGKNFQPADRVEKWLKKPVIAKNIRNNERIFSLPSGEFWNEEYLKTGWQNTDQFYYMINNLQPNKNMVYDISNLDVYPVLKTKRHILITNLIENNIQTNEKNKTASINKTAINILRQNNVTYLTSPYKIDNSNLNVIKTVKGNLVFYLYKIKNSSPKYYLSQNYQTAQNIEELVKLTSNLEKDWIVLEKKLPVKPENKNKTSLQIMKDNENYALLNVKTQTNTILVRAISFYPGWVAKIDGQQKELLAVNINQQGVKIPKGKHQVEFTYQPESFRKGMYISLISFLVWSVLLIKKLRELKATHIMSS